MEKRRQPEIIAGVVNSDGSIAAGDGFTVQKAGTATYVLTFPTSFRLISATGAADTAGSAVSVMISARTVNSVTFITRISNTATGADSTFAFTAVGVQQ